MKPDDVVAALGGRDIPVLASTIQGLRALMHAEDKISPRDISRVVLRDPMLTLKTLRFAEQRRTERQSADITTVEHAIMMHGVTNFLTSFASLTSLESLLAKDPLALDGALRVVSRAQHAAAFARAIARQRHDIESDEVIISALLHDLAELMLWFHMPRQQAEVRYLVDHAAGLRSASAQRAVLGFTHVELQLELARAWRLPELLRRLMDDDHAEHPRVVNVMTAAALARHLTHGWEDPALPDDYARLEKILGMSPDGVLRLVRNAGLQAAKLWHDTGIRPVAAWLPLECGRIVPEAPAYRRPGGVDLQFFKHAMARLEDPEHGMDNDAAIAWALYGLQFGLGLHRVMFAGVVPSLNALRPRFVLDDGRDESPWQALSLPLGGRDFFPRLMAKPQGLWAGGANREKLAALLLPEQRALLGGADFLAMSIYAGGDALGALIGDRGQSPGPIAEALYAPFKALCVALGHRLSSNANAHRAA